MLLAYVLRQAAFQAGVSRSVVDVVLVLCIASYGLYRRWKTAEHAAAFDRHFPVMRHGYLQQHVFQGPLRPHAGIKSLHEYSEYVRETCAKRKHHACPTVAPGCVDALAYSLRVWKGSVLQIDAVSLLEFGYSTEDV